MKKDAKSIGSTGGVWDLIPGKNTPLERALIPFGILDLAFAPMLPFLDWSTVPPVSRLVFVGLTVFGGINLTILFACDLQRPLWRPVVQTLLVANALLLILVFALHRANAL
jgi:hypothetical protein